MRRVANWQPRESLGVSVTHRAPAVTDTPIVALQALAGQPNEEKTSGASPLGPGSRRERPEAPTASRPFGDDPSRDEEGTGLRIGQNLMDDSRGWVGVAAVQKSGVGQQAGGSVRPFVDVRPMDTPPRHFWVFAGVLSGGMAARSVIWSAFRRNVRFAAMRLRQSTGLPNCGHRAAEGQILSANFRRRRSR